MEVVVLGFSDLIVIGLKFFFSFFFCSLNILLVGILCLLYVLSIGNFGCFCRSGYFGVSLEFFSRVIFLFFYLLEGSVVRLGFG